MKAPTLAALAIVAALTAAAPARAFPMLEDTCQRHILNADRELRGEALGGRIVYPAVRERCRENGMLPWPIDQYLSPVHRTPNGFCKFAIFDKNRQPTGEVYERIAGADCPPQSYNKYIGVSGVSDDEFIALLRFWKALCDGGKLPIDAVLARSPPREPDDYRAVLEGLQDTLAASRPEIEMIEGGADLTRYGLTPTQQEGRAYLISISQFDFIVFATASGFEIADIRLLVI